jgi:hypothetical protein
MVQFGWWILVMMVEDVDVPILLLDFDCFNCQCNKWFYHKIQRILEKKIYYVKHSTVHIEKISEKIQSQIHFPFKEITVRASMYGSVAYMHDIWSLVHTFKFDRHHLMDHQEIMLMATLCESEMDWYLFFNLLIFHFERV